MRRWTFIAVPLAAGIAATCAYNPPPVPVEGDPETLGFLAGEWSGEYRSEDTGRTGNVFFRLRAGADTAQGEVLMTPVHDLYPRHDLPHSPDELEMPRAVEAPPVVTIEFVRATGDWVYGTLDEYRDPECGCTLETTFTGRAVRDHLEGTFVTVHLQSGERHAGTWSARRTGPPPRAEEPSEPAPTPPPDPQEPGLKGPATETMIAQGRALFRDLGCSFCHGPDDRPRIGPDLQPAIEHQSFSWIYRMILNPDSMARHDPTAKALYEEYGFEMPERGATPWEALVLYEYLLAETLETARPEPR